MKRMYIEAMMLYRLIRTDEDGYKEYQLVGVTDKVEEVRRFLNGEKYQAAISFELVDANEIQAQFGDLPMPKILEASEEQVLSEQEGQKKDQSQ
jgi:hypothetical protein